jgi:hypothetical protein
MIASAIPSPETPMLQTNGSPAGTSMMPSSLQSTPPAGAKAPVAAAIASRSSMPPPPEEMPITLAPVAVAGALRSATPPSPDGLSITSEEPRACMAIFASSKLGPG